MCKIIKFKEIFAMEYFLTLVCRKRNETVQAVAYITLQDQIFWRLNITVKDNIEDY